MLSTVLALRREYREWKAAQRAGPEQRVHHQIELKAEFSSRLLDSDRDFAPRVVIRDLARLDDYPALDDRAWGISAWFRVESKGLYHRGIEVFLAVEDVIVERSVARPAQTSDAEPGATVFVVGRIPFDAIVAVDWAGDERYPVPHVYCWFNQADGPYEELVLYELGFDDLLVPREDLHYKPSRRSRLRQWQDHRTIKRAQRDFEREALSD